MGTLTTRSSSAYLRTGKTLALLGCMLLASLGCASQKATLDAPELPASHWLEEAPGVPAEHKEKLAAAVPNLYDSSKLFSFEDYVFLTIQQSPMLVNSAVDLEIKKLKLTDAIWQYLPEPVATVQVSSNLTTYNFGAEDASSNYGQTKFRIGFYASLPNPLFTYFNHQAQKVFVNLAVTTHRKAISKTILESAQTYHRLAAQNEILALQEELLPIMKKNITYWKELETADGRQGVALNLAEQREREISLKIERDHIKAKMLRTKLKILSGVNLEQKLNIDTKSASSILTGFNGNALNWEDRWLKTEDAQLIRSQIRLQDFNIMIAWAEYVPDITLRVDNYPPAGQYQPLDGKEDYFLHLTFDFPLIDWGRRYRGVQSARMSKAKAFQEQARARTTYANSWAETRQNVDLAETNLKIMQNSLEVAKMQLKEAEINFNEGSIIFPQLSEMQENLISAKIAYIEAELQAKLANTTWMDMSGMLKERFIGQPTMEDL